MKKLFFIAALALGCVTASAQKTLSLSTYSGTDLQKYDNKTMNVYVSRYVFKGWNTISLPFNVSKEQINEVFGNDCRLEKLAGVENDGMDIKMNFVDCKEEGIKANVPYILHYTGESTNKSFTVENATILNAEASVNFTVANTGETVTFGAAQKHQSAEGLYGILAKDNADAAFVNVDNTSTGFYATRCFIKLSSGNSTMLTSKHFTEGELTSINSVVKANEKVNVYNVSGVVVAKDATANDINNLAPGVYVVKSKKIMVK